PDIWTVAELIDVETGAATDILTYMNANTTVETFSDYQIAIYNGTVALGSPITPGHYYLRLNDGTDDFYSEVFLPCADLSEYVKVEWWRDSDLIYD
ncbi:MAG: hypothetical protein GWO38_31405, partial [Phycisphaerae bacterium]|nr:hypothetical protein [Phycisphaerae bacterium]NIP55663.1 hypothetical protein [Phycisphaerae bacterium]NIX01914.1 hypothetical protein [Phycisphaerae bacterium]NIX32011.1 hypothetical protein [Phycisphaerae bacterium]